MKLSNRTIASLINRNENKGTKVSIYIPTHPKSNGPNVQEDKTRFKNAIQEIKNHTDKHDETITNILYELNDILKQTEFWFHQSAGLAVIADNKGVETIKLPIEVTESTKVGSEFVLSPLILAQSMNRSYYVLDINLSNPRLFIADTTTMTRIEPLDLKSMKEMMESDYESNDQFHTPRGNRKSTPMYHGHGGSEDHKWEEEQIYLQYVAKNMQSHLRLPDMPLILSGDKQRVAQFMPMLTHKNITSKKLYGNHQHLNETQLHDLTYNIILDSVQKEIKESIKQRRVSRKLIKGWTDISSALNRKAVEKLYLPMLRNTIDSVKSGYKSRYLIDANSQIASLEKWVKDTINQGGKIQAIPVTQSGEVLPRAEIRF